MMQLTTLILSNHSSSLAELTNEKLNAVYFKSQHIVLSQVTSELCLVYTL